MAELLRIKPGVGLVVAGAGIAVGPRVATAERAANETEVARVALGGVALVNPKK
jgi:hypothetical protein